MDCVRVQVSGRSCGERARQEAASVGAGSRARRALQNLDVLSLLEIVPRCLSHGALLRHSAGHSLRLAFGDAGARPRLSSLGDPV